MQVFIIIKRAEHIGGFSANCQMINYICLVSVIHKGFCLFKLVIRDARTSVGHGNPDPFRTPRRLNIQPALLDRRHGIGRIQKEVDQHLLKLLSVPICLRL